VGSLLLGGSVGRLQTGVPIRGPRKTPPKWARKARPGRVGARASAVICATDALLTHAMFTFDRVWGAGPSPNASGVANGPPNPAALLLPRLRGLRCVPEALRLLWRTVLRGSDPNSLQNQGCGGVAVPQAGTVSTGGGYRFHWPIDRNSTVSPRVNHTSARRSWWPAVVGGNPSNRSGSLPPIFGFLH
jgi:hypothetical protein